MTDPPLDASPVVHVSTVRGRSKAAEPYRATPRRAKSLSAETGRSAGPVCAVAGTFRSFSRQSADTSWTGRPFAPGRPYGQGPKTGCVTSAASGRKRKLGRWKRGGYVLCKPRANLISCRSKNQQPGIRVHSAIIVVTIPDMPQAWDNFTGTIARKIRAGSTTKRRGENVWEVNFQQQPADLAWIIAGCEQFGLAYEILPLADPPRWQKVDPDSKPS